MTVRRVEVPDYSAAGGAGRYVTRWTLVASRWVSVFVHRYETADPRPTLHDHPWPFVSMILRGGYREIRRYGAAPVQVRWLNLKRSSDLHTICTLDRRPTWTVVVAGPRSHRWGYVERDGTWTPAEEHRHSAELHAALAVQARNATAVGRDMDV